MNVNTPLLFRVMFKIVMDPASYNQRFYGIRTECGTAYCIAGHTVVENGDDLVFGKPPREAFTACANFAELNQPAAWGVVHVNGEEVSAHHRAAELLGLDDDTAHELFHEDAPLPWIWAIVEDITDGEVTEALVRDAVDAYRQLDAASIDLHTITATHLAPLGAA